MCGGHLSSGRTQKVTRNELLTRVNKTPAYKLLNYSVVDSKTQGRYFDLHYSLNLNRVQCFTRTKERDFP